jgi:hypothetical protein
MVPVALFLVAALAQQRPPVPQPFPRPAETQPAKPADAPPQPPATAPREPATVKPAAVAPTTVCESAPTAAMLGVPIHPGAQFITCYDAGRGQKFYLFGSTASFTDLVTYYKNQLKKSGDLVFDAPATHEFEVGRFREETMAFPPGVTIKEYKSAISEGYPNPRLGGQPARFPTVIQIVPVTER